MLKFFNRQKPAVKSPVNALRDKYDRLCQQRDETVERVAPVQRKLEAVNARIQLLNAEAEKLAAEIQALRGGESWLHLKKEIGVLAKALSGMR